MSTSSKITENLLEPLLVGGVAAVAVKVLYPSTQKFSILGSVSLPDYVLFGAAVGASSAVSETIKLWILPYIPQSRSLASLESMLLGPAITGVTSIAAINILTDSKPRNMFNTFVLGAGSDIAGKYLYQFAKSARRAL